MHYVSYLLNYLPMIDMDATKVPYSQVILQTAYKMESTVNNVECEKFMASAEMYHTETMLDHQE